MYAQAKMIMVIYIESCIYALNVKVKGKIYALNHEDRQSESKTPPPGRKHKVQLAVKHRDITLMYTTY